VLALPAAATHAETHLTGGADAVRMEARAAPVEEVLTAMGASYGLRFRSATPLGDSISGTFQGSLPQIVARVLDGYDYIIKTRDGIVEVIVMGSHRGSASSPSTLPAGSNWFPVRREATSGAASPPPWQLKGDIADPAKRAKCLGVVCLNE
jgi:hypothetical protein